MIIIIVIILKNDVLKVIFMYVCICHDVKDHQIKTAITQGVDTLDALQQTLKVTTCCGCCQPMIEDLLQEYAPKIPFDERLAHEVAC